MIKFLVMDVDGTLTDGKIYIGNEGEQFKVFDVKDGYGIKEVLPQYGIIPVIITARKSESLLKRCEELGIKEVYQGVREKLESLKNLIMNENSEGNQYSLKNVAYIGDDILDMQCMKPIRKCGGLIGCPNDAVLEVKEITDFVCQHSAGNGAVREFVEYIVQCNEKEKENYYIQERINEAINYIEKLDKSSLMPGKYEVNENFYYTVQKYEAVEEQSSLFESHKKYIDIQYIVEGCEKMYVTDIENLKKISNYDDEKDVIYYGRLQQSMEVSLNPNTYIVLYPRDAHRVGKLKDCEVVKIVGKVCI